MITELVKAKINLNKLETVTICLLQRQNYLLSVQVSALQLSAVVFKYFLTYLKNKHQNPINDQNDKKEIVYNVLPEHKENVSLQSRLHSIQKHCCLLSKLRGLSPSSLSLLLFQETVRITKASNKRKKSISFVLPYENHTASVR